MANNFSTNEVTAAFGLMVDNNLRYTKASKDYFKGQIEGKRNGRTYKVYTGDPGVITSGIDLTSVDKSIVQKEVDITLQHAAAGLDIDILESVVDTEGFATEFKYVAQNLAASIDKRAVDATILKADGAFVVSAADYNALQLIGNSLVAAKAGGKKVGFMYPNVQGAIANSSMSNKFNMPSDIAKRLYEENAVGMYANVDWVSIGEIPTFVAGTFVGTSASTVGTTISADGATSLTIADAAITSASTVKAGQLFYINGVKNLDANNNPTQDNFAVIATAAATGTTGSITITINPIYFAKGAAKNVSVTSIASGTKVIPSGQVAGKSYSVIQGRTDAALDFGTYKLDDIRGSESSAMSVDGFNIRMCLDGDVNKGINTGRIDVGFHTELVNGKYVRLAFVQID